MKSRAVIINIPTPRNGEKMVVIQSGRESDIQTISTFTVNYNNPLWDCVYGDEVEIEIRPCR